MTAAFVPVLGFATVRNTRTVFRDKEHMISSFNLLQHMPRYKKYNLHVATTASTQCHIAVHILRYNCRFRDKGNIFQFESRLRIRLLRTTFFVLSAFVTSGAGFPQLCEYPLFSHHSTAC